ncbi:hypothetical protein HY091_00155 [Candidatus Kaiserbacteria bacterium]|nr:hypothetical protein [Candidatus Kaiserbacteria bacterium]
MGDKILKQLYNALVAKDALIYFARSHEGQFQCHGLCIMIRSRMPAKASA